MSLRQGNMPGAKGACACVCGSVLDKSIGLGAWLGRLGGGFSDIHIHRDSEMVSDGHGKTKRISPVCLRASSYRVTHT